MAGTNTTPGSGEASELVLGNNFGVRDFVSFYIHDEKKITALLAKLEARGISADTPKEVLEKSVVEFEAILQKIQAGDKLNAGEALEKNVFYVIFQEVQNFLMSEAKDQFKKYITASALSEGEKRKAIRLNEQILAMDAEKRKALDADLAKYVAGELTWDEVKDNPSVELYVILQTSLREGVANIDLHKAFAGAFPNGKRRAEVERNVLSILKTDDLEAIKETQDYKEFMAFLKKQQSGKLTPEEEKAFLFSGNKLYLAFQYIISEFIKEALKTLEKSTYLGIPPALGLRVSGENLELTKLFLLKYPTDAILMLLAFNGVFFGSQLVMSGFGVSPASMYSVAPSEFVAFMLSVLSVKLRTNAKNMMMQGNNTVMAILKSGPLPLIALTLVLAAHGVGAASVFSRTGGVKGTFTTIDQNFTNFSSSLRTVIGEPGKESDSELAKLGKKFLDKCIDVVTLESATGNQGRGAGFRANSYAKYYLCFGTSQKLFDRFTGANVVKGNAAYNQAVSFRKRVTEGVTLSGFNILKEDEHIDDFIVRRIQFFRDANKDILARIYANKKLVSDYKQAAGKGFVGNLIDYYIFQTGYNIESIEGELKTLTADADTLKASYDQLKDQLTLIRQTLVEGLNAIDRTGVDNPTPNTIDIVIPSLDIDTKVIAQIGPEVAKALEVSGKISTQPTELFGVLKGFYGFPLALTIVLGALIVAFTAETGPLFMSKKLMQRRGKNEANMLESFLPNLIKSMRIIVKKVKAELDNSQIATFLGIGEITEDQIMEGLLSFLKKNARLAMNTESIGKSVKRQVVELFDPFDHSANGERYNDIVEALEKLQSPKGLIEFLSETLPGLGQILTIYQREIHPKDLAKTPPNLLGVRKLPDTRNIAIMNNHRQKVLTYRRRKVGAEYLIGAIGEGKLTLESLKSFVSREDEEKLIHTNTSTILGVLERMKADYSKKAIEAMDDFKDVAKISDLDLKIIQDQLDALPKDEKLRANFEEQVDMLQGAISQRKKKGTEGIHTFEITSHINIDANILRFIIGDVIDTLG